MARDEYDDRDDRDREYDARDRGDDDRGGRGDRDYDAEDIDTARRKVKPPAICLIVVGVLYILGAVVSVVVSFATFDQQWDQAVAQQQARQQNNPQQAQANQAAQDMMKSMKPMIQGLTVIVAVVFAILASLIIFGASRMLSVSSRGWGMAAAIIALFPLNCYVWVFGIAFGIWGIVVLNNPEVKRGFAANRRGRATDRDDDRDRDDRR